MQRALIVVALFTAACGPAATRGASPKSISAKAAPGPGTDDDPDVICKIEIPTGSMLSRPVCRSGVQVEVDRWEARKTLLK